MSRGDKLILLSAPFTVLFELVCMLYILSWYQIDFNQPLSTLPYYHPEFTALFGIVLTVNAVMFSIFTLALRPYWRDAFRFSAICSALYIVTAWSPYDPFHEGSFWSVVHAGSANLAVLGYIFVIFQISQRTHGVLQQASKWFFRLALMGVAGVTVSIHILHVYAAWFQTFILLVVQGWALYVAYYLATKLSATP